MDSEAPVNKTYSNYRLLVGEKSIKICPVVYDEDGTIKYVKDETQALEFTTKNRTEVLHTVLSWLTSFGPEMLFIQDIPSDSLESKQRHEEAQ